MRMNKVYILIVAIFHKGLEYHSNIQMHSNMRHKKFLNREKIAIWYIRHIKILIATVVR